MRAISTIISLRCAVHVFPYRNSHSILLHYELTVTRRVRGIQESDWKLLPRTAVPLPACQLCLRERRWKTTGNPPAETTFRSSYKRDSLEMEDSGLFFGNYVPGKTWRESLLKACSAEPSLRSTNSPNKSQDGSFVGKPTGRPPMAAPHSGLSSSSAV